MQHDKTIDPDTPSIALLSPRVRVCVETSVVCEAKFLQDEDPLVVDRLLLNKLDERGWAPRSPAG